MEKEGLWRITLKITKIEAISQPENNFHLESLDAQGGLVHAPLLNLIFI